MFQEVFEQAKNVLVPCRPVDCPEIQGAYGHHIPAGRAHPLGEPVIRIVVRLRARRVDLGDRVEILAPAPVLAAIARDVLNDRVWPDFTKLPSRARPTVRLRPLAEKKPFRAGRVVFTPFPVSHVVPTYGYIVSKPGRSVVFSGDTEPTDRLWEAARRARDLKAIFLELSFSDSQLAIAQASLHMTPCLVRAELVKAPPRVLGAPNWIVPGAEMEATYFPQVDDIIDIVCAELIPEKKSNRRGLRDWNEAELAKLGL